jgi:hypothetical protein
MEAVFIPGIVVSTLTIGKDISFQVPPCSTELGADVVDAPLHALVPVHVVPVSGWAVAHLHTELLTGDHKSIVL